MAIGGRLSAQAYEAEGHCRSRFSTGVMLRLKHAVQLAAVAGNLSAPNVFHSALALELSGSGSFDLGLLLLFCSGN